jgi:hypothetical protein
MLSTNYALNSEEPEHEDDGLKFVRPLTKQGVRLPQAAAFSGVRSGR